LSHHRARLHGRADPYEPGRVPAPGAGRAGGSPPGGAGGGWARASVRAEDRQEFKRSLASRECGEFYEVDSPINAPSHLPDFRLLPDFAPLLADSCLIPASLSLVPAASSSGGIIARTAPAITLMAVLFSVLVAPLFLLAALSPPDFLASVLDPADREDLVISRVNFAMGVKSDVKLGANFPTSGVERVAPPPTRGSSLRREEPRAATV
jgi:hypothetical protein